MKLILLSLILCLLVCCKGKHKEETALYNINVTPKQNEIILSDWFTLDTVFQIKGELVAEIEKIIPITDGYIVMGRSALGGLFRVSSKGEYMGSIIGVGRGANEVINIVDVAPDEKNKDIIILADFGREVVIYSVEQSIITNRFTLPESYIARSIAKLDSARYVIYKDLPYSDRPEYKVSVYNSLTDEIEANYLPLNKEAAEYISFIQRNNLFRNNNTICFYESFLDTVYSVSSDGINALISFEKDVYQIPEKKLYSGYKDFRGFMDFCIKSKYIWAHVNLYKCGDLILSQYVYDNVDYINVASVNSYNSLSDVIINDDVFLDGMCPVLKFNIVGCGDEYLFLAYEPDFIGKYKETKSMNIDEDESSCVVILKRKNE